MSENADDPPPQDKPADSAAPESDQPEFRPPLRKFNRALLGGSRARLKAKALELLQTGEYTRDQVAERLQVNPKTITAFVREEGLAFAKGHGQGTRLVVSPKGPRGNRKVKDGSRPPTKLPKPKPTKKPGKAPKGPDPLDPDVMVADLAKQDEVAREEERRRKDRERKRLKRGSKATDDDDRDRLPVDAVALDDSTKDRVGALVVPDGFDPQARIAQLAMAFWLPEAIQLSALRILAQMQQAANAGRGKIDWEAVTVASIPEEHRHRLAGALLAWVDYAELPETVRLAPREARAVYRLIGLLPESPAATETVRRRWVEMRKELRELVGGATAVVLEAKEPVQPTLAAETRYQPPRWGTTQPQGQEDDNGLS